MTPVQTLFGFKGRIRRKDWWLWVIGLAVAHVAVAALISLGLGLDVFAAESPLSTLFGAARRLPLWAAVPFELLFLWPTTALGVKRLQDRNVPGWPVAVFYAVALVMGFFARQDGGAAAGKFGGAGGLLLLSFNLVYLAVAIGFLVTLGFLAGTPGDNRFGPSPKAEPASAE
ncbi:MAG: DUF805 domain-containing protein [Caulobacter sp.]|nr:DUF805 domain-containing protein [Caulobacter sp.]